MAVSQFTIYTSADSGGPGLITGMSGSLISVLDACLVNGYTNKPAAGWSKPLGNFFAGYSAPTISAYQQGSGSRCILYVNDAAPIYGIDAWVSGWETMTSLTGSPVEAYAPYGFVGSGSGQFPDPTRSQTLQNGMNTAQGHLCVHKSSITGSYGRHWMIAADAYTMYMWILTNDQPNNTTQIYHPWMFGDIFSFAGPNDYYKCMILCSGADVNGGANTFDALFNTNYGGSSEFGLATPHAGAFIVRGPGATNSSSILGGGSINVSRMAGTYGVFNYVNTSNLAGTLPTPNSTDQAIWFSNMIIADPSTYTLRGRMRGLYFMGHGPGAFNDGQIIQGAGDFAGKTFLITKRGIYAGAWAVEISPTVETN